MAVVNIPTGLGCSIGLGISLTLESDMLVVCVVDELQITETADDSTMTDVLTNKM